MNPFTGFAILSRVFANLFSFGVSDFSSLTLFLVFSAAILSFFSCLDSSSTCFSIVEMIPSKFFSTFDKAGTRDLSTNVFKSSIESVCFLSSSF